MTAPEAGPQRPGPQRRLDPLRPIAHSTLVASLSGGALVVAIAWLFSPPIAITISAIVYTVAAAALFLVIWLGMLLPRIRWLRN
ncbi:MAG TPA: hypothetical protein VIJ18_10105 [Microbacteriaceae bacterium]